jgi:hypothetical protein
MCCFLCLFTLGDLFLDTFNPDSDIKSDKDGSSIINRKKTRILTPLYLRLPADDRTDFEGAVEPPAEQMERLLREITQRENDRGRMPREYYSHCGRVSAAMND